MKKNVFKASFGIFILVLAFSCTSSSNQTENKNKDSLSVSPEQKAMIDYSGVYKTSADNLCKMTLTIAKEGQDYSYQISMDKLNYSGKLIFEEVDGQVYVSFNGQIGDNAPKSVSGQFLNGAIMIQNYGNSMNEYHYFKQCDEKYLEFKK